MSDAKRDNNFVTTALAYDGVSTTEPLRVDAATSRLLIEINYVPDETPPTLVHKRDNNFVPVAYAVTDDANETPTPLIVDTTNNYLFIDIG